MADVNTSIDANEKLRELKSYAQHYREVAEGTAEQAPNPHATVSVAELAVVLETMIGLIATLGIGARRNEVGQAMPKKRGWERHG